MKVIDAIEELQYCAKLAPGGLNIACEIAISALKKQIPMEHHHTMVGECSGGEKIRTSICPNCLGCIMTVKEEFPRFCAWCGQAIDWEGID